MYTLEIHKILFLNLKVVKAYFGPNWYGFLQAKIFKVRPEEEKISYVQRTAEGSERGGEQRKETGRLPLRWPLCGGVGFMGKS